MRKINKFVIAYDKFKDCLKASQLCHITGKALENSLGNGSLNIKSIPLADGGDGFLDCIEEFYLSTSRARYAKASVHPFSQYNMRKVELNVTGPLGSPVKTSYLLMNPKENTGNAPISFIEQALVAGLQMVPIPQRSPFKTTSKGVGEVILDAYRKGAKEIYLGIGGSATVDFGIGAIHALGVPIYDINNKRFPPSAALTGGDIKNISDIEYLQDKKLLEKVKLHMVCDVNNPLLGPNGAVYVYGKQKGAKDEELPILESYMEKLSNLFTQKSKGKVNLADIPKMGAAGAIGAGLSCFIQSEFHSGIELIADLLGLDSAIKASDAVITGEGAFDTQTLEGKTVSHVIKTAKKYGKKVIVICGINKVPREISKNLGIDIYDLKSRFSVDACFKRTEDCINRIVTNEIKPTLH